MSTTRRTVILLPVAAFLAIGTFACSKKLASLKEVESQTAKQKAAIVSFTINDYGGSLQGWNKQNVGGLLDQEVNGMLAQTEQRLGTKWDVIPASEFVSKPEYQAVTGYDAPVIQPQLGGASMRVVAGDRKQLVRTVLDPQKAQALAAATGAQVLFVIYNEWTVATGRMVPTSKPLTKTVMSIYSASGEHLYFGRKDTVGERTLGAFGKTNVDAETIKDWVSAYFRGLDTLLQG